MQKQHARKSLKWDSEWTLIANKQENWRFPCNTLQECKSCIITNLAGHMQVNKCNEKLLPKAMIVWLLLMTWGHQSSVKSYNWRSSTSKTLLLRWLAQASNMQKIKGLHSTNNLPCINNGINNAMSGSNNSQTCPNKYLSFHSHPIFILSIYLPNSMEWRQCRAWKASCVYGCDTKVNMAMTTF
jgi:hypothetical protein